MEVAMKKYLILLFVSVLITVTSTSLYAHKEKLMKEKDMKALVLYVTHPITVKNAALFIRSIRSFGEEMKEIPIHVMVDESAGLDTRSLALPGVSFHPIEIAPELRSFPFSRKVHACATAETLFEKEYDILIYADTEMLAFHSLKPFLPREGKMIRLQPVMLLNTVGQSPDTPPDRFWQALYDDAGVSSEDVPVIKAFVEEKEARLYINCEIMAVRPGEGLFRAWKEVFVKRLNDTGYREKIAGDQLHMIFLHQAALSAVIAARFSSEEIDWIPPKTFYPVHLHERMPIEKRIRTMEEAALVGYDLQNSGNPGILDFLPLQESHRRWIIDSVCSLLQEAPGVYREEGDCNTVVVETDNGYILIDPSSTGHDTSWLTLKFKQRALQAVLFTHAHQDHTNGFSLWPSAVGTPVIIQREWEKTYNYPLRFESFYTRRNRKFTGGGWMPRKAETPLLPTITFIDEWKGVIDGVEVVLIHAPAETEDASLIWFPQKRTLLSGDCFSGAFPMLGTPRGSTPRFADDYISALNRILSLHPALLIPGHGTPVRKPDEIQEKVTRVRDALDFVNQAVITGMNEGQSVHDLIAQITLPEELRLPELFGKVSWAVRALYYNYAGWYDEELSSLLDVPLRTLYSDIREICPPGLLLEKGEALLKEGKAGAALSITDMVLADEDGNTRALRLRREALRTLLAQTDNWGESNLFKTEIRRIERVLKE